MATIIRKTSPEVSVLASAINSAIDWVGAGSKVHRDASEQTVTAAAASSLATSLTLANQIKRIYAGSPSGVYGGWVGHISDTLAHLVADSTNIISAADATSLATVQTLLNAIKAAYNAHLTQAGVHPNNDVAHAVATADATDQASANALANALKAALNLHMADAPTEVSHFRVVDA